MSSFLEELRWRGMLSQVTPDAEKALSEGKMPVGYIGFDPTASGLGIGNYVQVMILKLFQMHGGKPIAVVGGATGRVGDPSGKDKERDLLDLDVLEQNLANFRASFQEYLDFSDDKPNKAEIVDNYDIYKNMNVLEFLRDVGKNLTINYMMSKDSVQNRLERGLSFTEFSYQLLQGYDFVWLYQNKGCQFQFGGSDQWGNITTGTELIRKMLGEEAHGHAVTINLLTNKEGKKFGKTESGNIFIDPKLTTPFAFYQYWFNLDDQDIIRVNRYFTLRSREETEALEADHQARLGDRVLQKAFGEELTTRLHGAEAYHTVLAVTDLFHNKKMTTEALKAVSAEALAMAAGEVQSAQISKAEFEGTPLRELIVTKANFFSSMGEVIRAVKANALSVNKQKVSDPLLPLSNDDLIAGKYILVEFGKKEQYILEVLS